MHGYPPGYCESGAKLAMAERDAAMFKREAKRKLENWSRVEEDAARAVKIHHRECFGCRTKPVLAVQEPRPEAWQDTEALHRIDASLAGVM